MNYLSERGLLSSHLKRPVFNVNEHDASSPGPNVATNIPLTHHEF